MKLKPLHYFVAIAAIVIIITAYLLFFHHPAIVPPVVKKKASGASGTKSAPGPKHDTPDAPFPLKKGSNGKTVVTLQHALNQAYGSGLVEDGDFGPATLKALQDNTGYDNIIEKQFNAMTPYIDKTYAVFGKVPGNTGQIWQLDPSLFQKLMDENADF
jgi:hypothetical protein